MSLLDYERRFSALRLNASGGNKSPHKVAMLLAVIDRIESGQATDNRFYFDEGLRQGFGRHVRELAGSSDRNNPHLPFFHLRGDGFWDHKVRPGQRESYERLSTATSPGIIDSHIEYAFLDEELFELLGNQIVRELLKAALLTNLDESSRRGILQTQRGWDWLECEFLIGEYMVMLEKHLQGVPYSKAEHRRSLQPRLNNRSNGAIEFKHQNVSAVLLELGLPYIPGYKPAFNYQQQLKQVVLSYLAGHQKLLDDVSLSADKKITDQDGAIFTWDRVFDPDPPEHIPRVMEAKPKYLARQVDYTERESRNRQLGRSAEAFIVALEKQRLSLAGRPDLADEVVWSSEDYGDGLGYDIRSFDALSEEERFLEVKATNSGKYQPFFISENERAFSNDFASAFRLYRVYEFEQAPRLFVLPGAIERHVQLSPKVYQARF